MSPTPIRIYGRRCPRGRSGTWERVSTVAQADTLMQLGDKVFELPGPAGWRVTGFTPDGRVTLAPLNKWRPE